MNDEERNLWVDNDKELCQLWKKSGHSKRVFIRQHRELIDNLIANVTSGKKPAHYLAYQGHEQ